MKSKKKLFELLQPCYQFSELLSLASRGVMDETYGKKSFIYFHPVTELFGISSKELVSFLEERGFKAAHWNGRNGVEVQVSYFKGTRWNE